MLRHVHIQERSRLLSVVCGISSVIAGLFAIPLRVDSGNWVRLPWPDIQVQALCFERKIARRSAPRTSAARRGSRRAARLEPSRETQNPLARRASSPHSSPRRKTWAAPETDVDCTVIDPA